MDNEQVYILFTFCLLDWIDYHKIKNFPLGDTNSIIGNFLDYSYKFLIFS